MRLFSALSFFLALLLVLSMFAAYAQGAQQPARTPDTPVERIYLDTEVVLDEFEQFASDKDGIPISGTIQSFYPNGRLAWETQWVLGKLHGITRGYYENREIREETTWVGGTLHGPARWYDENGRLLREIVYENGKDPSAPAEDREEGASAGQGAAEGAKK